MTRIGIIAAMPGELKSLVQNWKSLPLPRAGRGAAAWLGVMGDAECVAVCAGMGAEAAERACAIAAESGPLNALVSVGWAGALSCGVQPANAYVVNEVVDTASSERFSTRSSTAATAAMLKLVTIDHVAHPAEKRKLAETYRAVLVDMEAATVARFARDHGIAFYCLKAVSDVAGEVLPDFSRYTDGEGQLRLPALLAHVALRPQYWAGLARIGGNGRKGAVEIAAALGPLLSPLIGPLKRTLPRTQGAGPLRDDA
jgi:adenosylhomocysteine nucleosidase